MALKNVAIIGLGIGRAHLAEGYAKHPDKFRVLALCDLDETRLAKIGAEFAVPRRTRRFEEVLSMADIDVHPQAIRVGRANGFHEKCTLTLRD